MNLSSDLNAAFHRVTACCSQKPGFSGLAGFAGVRSLLLESLQASNSSVRHAHQAWTQLEMLGVDVMSIAGAVDLVDKDALHNRFKDAKLMIRDSLVWQAVGRFRTALDVQMIMDFRV